MTATAFVSSFPEVLLGDKSGIGVVTCSKQTNQCRMSLAFVFFSRSRLRSSTGLSFLIFLDLSRLVLVFYWLHVAMSIHWFCHFIIYVTAETLCARPRGSQTYQAGQDFGPTLFVFAKFLRHWWIFDRDVWQCKHRTSPMKLGSTITRKTQTVGNNSICLVLSAAQKWFKILCLWIEDTAYDPEQEFRVQ